jgi:hypothetical protein
MLAEEVGGGPMYYCQYLPYERSRAGSRRIESCGSQNPTQRHRDTEERIILRIGKRLLF